MKKIGIALSVVAVTLFCGGLLAFGQQLPVGSVISGDTYTIDFTGNYTATWYSASQNQTYGAGIYSATISGGILNNAPVGMICDDFANDISSGNTWTATAYQASVIPENIGSTLFGNTIGVTGYAQIAFLMNAMFSGVGTGSDQTLMIGMNTVSGVTQADLSSAIWYIGAQGSTNVPPLGDLSTNAQTIVSDLQGHFGTNGAEGSTAEEFLDSMTNLFILVPSGNTWNPQEVGISVPEGGATWMYLLMALAACVGFIRFGRRDQTASL